MVCMIYKAVLALGWPLARRSAVSKECCCGSVHHSLVECVWGGSRPAMAILMSYLPCSRKCRYGIHIRPILHRSADHWSRMRNGSGLIINPCTVHEATLHSRISNTTLMEGRRGRKESPQIEKQGQIRLREFRRFVRSIPYTRPRSRLPEERRRGCCDTLLKEKSRNRWTPVPVPVREYNV